MTTTTKTKHMSATLDYIRGAITAAEREGRAQDNVTRDGEPVTFEEARAALDEMQAAGILYVTGCSDTTPDGRCAGHIK